MKKITLPPANEILRRLATVDSETSVHIGLAKTMEAEKDGIALDDLAFAVALHFLIAADESLLLDDPRFASGHQYINALVDDPESATETKKFFDELIAEGRDTLLELGE